MIQQHRHTASTIASLHNRGLCLASVSPDTHALWPGRYTDPGSLKTPKDPLYTPAPEHD